jgi:hypothetical protein
VSGEAKLDIIMENAIAGNELYDVFTPSKDLSSATPSVTIKANDVLTFVAANAAGTDWFTTAGTVQPFAGYEYKRGLLVSSSTGVPFTVAPIGTGNSIVKFINLREDNQGAVNVLTYDSASGRIYYTASAYLAGGGAGDITEVIAGIGLDGGGSAGSVTLDVNYTNVSASMAGFGFGSGAGGTAFPFSGNAVISGSLLITGSGLTVTGSTQVSGSTFITGQTTISGSLFVSGAIESRGSGHIITYNTSSGLFSYTASNAIGGGGSSFSYTSTSSIIGNGTATSFNINHGFGTRNLHITVYESGSNGETVYPDIRRINVNTASIIFATAPLAAEYIVYISQ